MTDAELDELYEQSKNDREIMVGSDVRYLIGRVRTAESLVRDLGQFIIELRNETLSQSLQLLCEQALSRIPPEMKP